ncbi:MAG TPA: hypothetical protein VHB21_21500 [Minicystis sp.]|nr:hypothetical protein [Minicystis sp.]
MSDELLRNVLEAVQGKPDKDGWVTFPEGRLLTLYAGHDGVPLTIQKVEAVRIAHNLVRARNVKGEHFLLALADVFAAALDAGTEAATARKAGFLG